MAAMNFSGEQCSDCCWDMSSNKSAEQWGTWEETEIWPLPKIPEEEFSLIASCTKSQCFMIFFPPKYKHTKPMFFKRVLHELDIQIIFSFRKWAHILEEQRILTEPVNCFVKLILLPFSLLQERQFRCESAKGQQAPLSGTRAVRLPRLQLGAPL